MTPKDYFDYLIHQQWTGHQIRAIEEKVDTCLNELKANPLFGSEDEFYRRLCSLFFECREEYITFSQNVSTHLATLHNLELKLVQDYTSDQILENYEAVKAILEVCCGKTYDGIPVNLDDIILESYGKLSQSDIRDLTREGKNLTSSEYREIIIDEISCAICEELLDYKNVDEQIELNEFYSKADSFLYESRAAKLKAEKIVISTLNKDKKLHIRNKSIIKEMIEYGLPKAMDRCAYLANLSTPLTQLKERKKKIQHRVVRRIVMVLVYNKVIIEPTTTQSTFIAPDGSYMQISNDLGALLHDVLMELKLIEVHDNESSKLDKANKIRSFGGYAGKSSIELEDKFSYNDITHNPLECCQKYNKRMGYR